MNRRALLAAMVVSSGLTSLPTTALVLAVPVLHRDFHASISELQWTLTAYSLAYSSLLVVAGRLGDLRGRARFFLAGTGLWVGAAVVAALAPDALTLIVAMAALGAASAALTPASLALITQTFSGAERTKAIATWGAASALMSGLGPTLGGVLTVELSWQWIFWLCAAIGAATAALAFAAGVEESRSSDHSPIDVRGVTLLIAGLTTMSLGLIEGPEWEFYAPQTIVLIAVGVGLLLAFVVAERRAAVPIVDFDLFRARNFVGGAVVKFSVNFALAGFFVFMSLYLQEVLHYSAEEAGLALLPLSVTFLAMLPVGTRIALRFGPRPPILVGLSLTAVAFALLSSLDKDMRYVDLAPEILLLGLGVGLTVTPMNAAAMDAVARARHGEAAGVLSTVIGLGSILGIAVGGSLFQELHERRLTDFLRASGTAIDELTQRQLNGILMQSPKAEATLSRFGDAEAHRIVTGIREAFVFGISGAMWLGAGMTLAALAASALLLRRQGDVSAS